MIYSASLFMCVRCFYRSVVSVLKKKNRFISYSQQKFVIYIFMFLLKNNLLYKKAKKNKKNNLLWLTI